MLVYFSQQVLRSVNTKTILNYSKLLVQIERLERFERSRFSKDWPLLETPLGNPLGRNETEPVEIAAGGLGPRVRGR